MDVLLTIIHIVSALVLIAVVLLQQGKGADIGAAFGGGASQTVFGARGAGNVLTKLTTVFVVLFMLTSMGLAYRSTPDTIFDEEEAPALLSGEEEASTGATETPSGFEETPATSGEGDDAIPGFESAPVAPEAPEASEPAPVDAAPSAEPNASAPAPSAPAPSAPEPEVTGAEEAGENDSSDR